MRKIIKTRKKFLIPLISIILIILIIFYGNIIKKNIKKKSYAKKNMQIYTNNEEEVFKIQKIILCSSANAIDLSEAQNLQDLTIYQYTDMAVYIDNGEELSNKNTVKKLYIDNIIIDGKERGEKSLNYKNMLQFGLKQNICEAKQTNDINFNIVYTNNENEEANYDEATFFTDCSNPITLEYLNYDVVTGYKMEENKSVSFDGSILKEAGISKEDIDCKVRFRINIINNDNEKYSCPINFKIPLSDIYNGTTMKSKTTEGAKYCFFRES